MNRRTFLTGLTAAAAAPTPSAESTRRVPQPRRVSQALAALQCRPLPLGSIQPAGWLRRQLRIQADGLSGHLDEFWPDVARSRWFGGDAEGWERAPYWLDGAMPLAWQLRDAALQARIARYVDHIVAHQRSDGVALVGPGGFADHAAAGSATPPISRRTVAATASTAGAKGPSSAARTIQTASAG